MPGKRKILDVDDLVQRYQSGQTMEVIAVALGIGVKTVKDRLMLAGVPVRRPSEYVRIEWANRTAEERRAFLKNAHAATAGRMSEFARMGRGRQLSPASVAARAKTRGFTKSEVGQGEQLMIDLLAMRGLVFESQFPVGPYNIDLALYPVAVEVSVAACNPLKQHTFGTPERIKYLTDRGWHVLYIWATKGHRIDFAAADDVIAFFEQARTDPSPVGQYRVIRGCGELVAAGRGDVDKWAAIPTPRSANDPRNRPSWLWRKRTDQGVTG